MLCYRRHVSGRQGLSESLWSTSCLWMARVSTCRPLIFRETDMGCRLVGASVGSRYCVEERWVKNAETLQQLPVINMVVS